MSQTDRPARALYIAGEWRTGGGRVEQEVLNPATGAMIGTVPHASAADLEEALAVAERGFRAWRETAGETRAAVLSKTAA
ncbi:MAG: aldehyde dehydrogenase family protein, partial [Sphingomonadales bacterium]|nr:aldehyde dehydrogenase family protein [Sphingomonadales bacterium]